METMTDQKLTVGKLIRFRGFIPLAVLLGLGLLYVSAFLDRHLVALLERQLSKTNGAPVKISSIKTNFIRGELQLNGMEIWFPSSPTNESLVLEEIKVKLRHLPLLERKIYIENLSIDGVSFGQASRELTVDEIHSLSGSALGVGLMERVAYGFYGDLRKQIGENPFRRIGVLLSGLDLGSEVKREQKSLIALRQLQTGAQVVKDADRDLKGMYQELPKTETLVPPSAAKNDEMRPEAEQRKEAEESLPAILAAEERVKALNDKMEKRFQEAVVGVGHMQEAIRQDIQRFTARLNLPRLEGNDLTPSLLGTSLLNLLSRMTYWADLSRRKFPKMDQQKDLEMATTPDQLGTTVYFGQHATYPWFTLAEGSIRSSPKNGTNRGEVNGEVRNFSSDPHFIGKPMSLHLLADFPQSRLQKFLIQAEIDHSGKENKERFRVSAANFPLDQLPVNDTGDLTLFLKTGDLGFELTAEYLDNTLSTRFQGSFSNVEYVSSSHYRRIEDAVRAALSELKQFELTASFEGEFDKIVFKATSDLGRKISASLNKDFKHQFGAIEDDLRKNLWDLIYPRHQAQLSQLAEIRQQWLSPVLDRWQLIQALRHRAEKLVTRSKGGRTLSGSRENVKKPSRSRTESSSRRL